MIEKNPGSKHTSRTGVPKEALKFKASCRTKKNSRVSEDPGLKQLGNQLSSGKDKERESSERTARETRTQSSLVCTSFVSDGSTNPSVSTEVSGHAVQYPRWL
jgi:hypothetical protein